MILLGLTGPARSGKSTVAEYLERHHGFRCMSFAAPIKLAGAAKFAEPLELWNGDGTKDAQIPGHAFTRREWMQEFGQWLRARWGEDIWVRLAARRLAAVGEEPARRDVRGVVFSDVRLDSEASFITAEGGVIWQIWRPSHMRAVVRDDITERGISAKHPSRAILNHRGLDELYQRIEKLLADIRQGATI